jgi:hypothetical protein
MAELREIRLEDHEAWPECLQTVMSAPDGAEDWCDPAEVLVEVDDVGPQVHVAWQPNELEVAALARGGTIWLTMTGGLAPHRIDVK